MELKFREPPLLNKYLPKSEPEPIPDMSKMTMDEVFELYQKLPDWNRLPMPDVFYTHYNIKKPKPAEINEIVTYQPPPSDSQRCVERRGPVPGGIREVPTLPPIDIQTEFIADCDEAQVPTSLTPDETDGEHREETQKWSEDSIKPIVPKIPALRLRSLSSSHDDDVDQGIVPSVPPHDAS